MRTCYCCLIVGLLCSTIPSKQRHIPETTSMSSSRLNRLSCLQLCLIGQAAQANIPAECEELCRSRIQTRECPKLSGDIFPRSDINVDFKEDANGSWSVVVDWSHSRKVKARYKYRLQYVDSYKNNFAAHCIIVQNKTHVTLHSGEDGWTYPNAISLLVSIHHSVNASEPTGEPHMYNFHPSSSLIPVSLDNSSEKGYQWVIILGVILGIALATTVIIGIVCRKRRDWRYGHIQGLKASGSDTMRTGESTYMVSYFPENEEYTRKIAKIVNQFRKSGYDMIMDVMASTEMSALGPTGWAEREIKRAAKVLVFFSPSYVKICTNCDELVSKPAPDAVARVWYEIRCLKTVFCNTHSSAKMVCILMDDKVDAKDLPTWAEVRYRWPRDCEAIVRRLCSRDETSSTVRIAHATKSDSKSY